MPGLEELLLEMGLYDDLEAELDRCVPPKFASPHPSRTSQLLDGVYFDPEEVRRFLGFMLRLRHIKGRWAGRKLRPELWQVLFLLAPVFGWRRANGNRLYLEAFWEVPRKNGKSTLSSAIVLFLLMCDSNLRAGRLFEAGAEVYTLAATTAQAQVVFRPAELMAARSPSLARKLGGQKGKNITYEATASRCEVISGAPSTAEEKMGYNPSGYVADEVHVYKSRDSIDTMESGGGARDQTLGVLITTAGLDQPGTIYTEKRDLAEEVARGLHPDVRMHVAIFTIDKDDVDRWDQPDVWAKANPNLHVSVQEDFLKDQAAKARRSEAARLKFLRLYLNVRTQSTAAWIPILVWDRSAGMVDERKLRLRESYMGLDLSSRIDLTALAVWVPDPTMPGYWDLILRYWLPKDGIADREAKDRAPYQQWAKDGYLTLTEGSSIDRTIIRDAWLALADQFPPVEAGYDPWGAAPDIAEDVAAETGMAIVPIRQGFRTLSPPMREMEALAAEGKLRHGGNPILRWNIQNVAAVMDAHGNVKPDKKKSKGRIDGVAAAITGMACALRHLGDGEGEESEWVRA